MSSEEVGAFGREVERRRTILGHHQKLVGSEPAKPPRQNGDRQPLLNHGEAQRFRQAMRNHRDAFGSWSCLAAAMGVQPVSLSHIMHGSKSVSGEMIVRAMRTSGLDRFSLKEVRSLLHEASTAAHQIVGDLRCTGAYGRAFPLAGAPSARWTPPRPSACRRTSSPRSLQSPPRRG